ncbi:MAG TPA: sugar phosphate isomerase/epimerase family protein [Clostridia bacterium]|nr:sugar phosphate isomerase/epimerase family protein [Clostridia bacterium]
MYFHPATHNPVFGSIEADRPLLSRRGFITKTALAAAAAALGTTAWQNCFAADRRPQPIVVFSKIFQSLKLSFSEAAALAAEAGLDGVDCPVRPGGEVLPERVADDLPAYVEALRKNKLGLPLIATAITGPDSPHTETILRTAKKVGVQRYRLGFVYHQKDVPPEKLLRETRAKFKDLAALNREIGIGADFENHSGGPYVGGDLEELRQLVTDFKPAEIGIAFDIAHALIVHGDNWKPYTEKLKDYLQVTYIKDVSRAGKWVPLGEGRVKESGYFQFLKQIGYRAPISLHVEYNWAPKGQAETREGLVKALAENVRVLKDVLNAV